MKSETNEYLIGIDEAGRGPLAGPVAVGVSFIPKQFQKEVFSLLKKAGLNDSKQVKEKTREELYEMLVALKKEKKINWEVMLVSAKVISTKRISYAINFGIQKGLEKLLECHPELVSGSRNKTTRSQVKPGMTILKHKIILELDGALKIPQGNWKKSSVIIKGDSIKPSIMIASIVAKVTRDRYMKKLSKKYPQYGFEIHKGYGTQKHRDLIKKYGPSKEHRVGWCKN
jgi:ribonuclease HII